MDLTADMLAGMGIICAAPMMACTYAIRDRRA